MGRQEKIARSVVRVIIKPSGTKKQSSSPLARILALFSTFFSLYQLLLRKVRPADFSNLRRNYWHVSDDAYVQSFEAEHDRAGSVGEESLKAIGDMGFSGSVSRPWSKIDWQLTLIDSRPSTPPPTKSILSSPSHGIPSTRILARIS